MSIADSSQIVHDIKYVKLVDMDHQSLVLIAMDLNVQKQINVKIVTKKLR